jgi:GT2 family glycosyltransferase
VENDVAVVIGNYQGEPVLGECLDSLAGQTSPVREIIVADGSSRDGSREIAEKHGARFLAFPNNGLGVLYNRGVEAAQAPYVLLLNNDVALDRRCVELLATELETNPTRFAADPTQFDWSGNRVIHARTTLRRGRLSREYIPGLHLDSVVRADAVVATVCANGAAMLVRRQMFLELGGFDETFFMEWEDLDLCWRAWMKGWPTVYVPDAAVRHRVGAVTTDAAAPRRSASSHHNLLRFGVKCLPLPAVLHLAGGELLRLPKHPRAVCSGFAAFTAQFRDTLQLRSRLRPHGPTWDRLVTQ